MSIIGIAGIAVLALAGLIAVAIFLVSSSRTPTLTVEHTRSLANGTGARVDVLTASFRDVRKGGLVEARGFGGDDQGVNLLIDDYNSIKAGDEVWHELVTEFKGRGAALAWHERAGGETETFAVRRCRSLTVADLGLSEAELEGALEGRVARYEGMEASFSRSGEALFHKGESGFGKSMKYWLFVAPGKGWLRVERRPDDSLVASYGVALDSAGVTVLKVRG